MDSLTRGPSQKVTTWTLFAGPTTASQHAGSAKQQVGIGVECQDLTPSKAPKQHNAQQRDVAANREVGQQHRHDVKDLTH